MMKYGDVGMSNCYLWFPEGIWLVVFRPTPLKNDGVKVSWDDDIPNIWEKNPNVQTTNQVLYLL